MDEHSRRFVHDQEIVVFKDDIERDILRLCRKLLVRLKLKFDQCASFQAVEAGFCDDLSVDRQIFVPYRFLDAGARDPEQSGKIAVDSAAWIFDQREG